MNRSKILAAFEKVPNIIEEAQNKAHTFRVPVHENRQRTAKLDQQVQELRITLLRVLPVLINILIPNTFRTLPHSAGDFG